MSRYKAGKTLLGFMAAPAVAALFLGMSMIFAAAANQPNIVVFLADDHGYLDSEVSGATDVRTPHMRRLAEAGMTFSRCFVASPSCAPSRAALLTGLMPARNGAEANHSRPRREIKKLPKYLQELAYQVAGFGKVAHYNHDAEYGFDHYDKRNDPEVIAAFVRQRDPSRPLCLFVGSHTPHVPWTNAPIYDPSVLRLPPNHADTPETRQFRAKYYTDVTLTDTHLGEIYKLAQHELGTDTLFIYSSDHGAQWPFGKWNLYDAGTRVLFIASWPGKVQPNTQTEAMISWVDILPTLVEAGGGKAPTDLDGTSFLPILQGQKQTHRERVFSTHSGDGRMNVYPIRSLRTVAWKYILNLHPEYLHTTHIDKAKPQDGVGYWRSWEAAASHQGQAARLVERYRTRPSEELYDLRNDPFEQNNLSHQAEYAERLGQMRKELEDWMLVQNDQRKVFHEPWLKDSAEGPGARWVRSGLNTNSPVWGAPGGLQFALHPGGFTEGQGGPRGLIRIGYPTLLHGGVDLINFIAVEPVVKGRKGYSELERSAFDGKPGKYLWAGSSEKPQNGAVRLAPGKIRQLGGGVDELEVTVHVEQFENGAHVRLRLTQRSDAPNELRLAVEAEPDSAPMESCVLTATMGNKARTRLLFLKDGPVSSLKLYPDYRGKDFTAHRIFGLERLPRLPNGDVLAAVGTDEEEPASVHPFGRPGFWDYRGAKVMQYWRKPSVEVGPELACAVNGRFTYWLSEQPIPGGIAFENFELREPFRNGQSFIFGISRQWPGLGSE